jgi:predicted F0F1-ATPase subunit
VTDDESSARSAQTQERTRRDVERRRRREPGGRFWRSIALVGSVGWPIVLLATGGALLGRGLDAHWRTGVRCTLALLLAGTAAGSYVAWRTVREDGS